MEPNDQQLQDQLAGGPLTRNGFDDRLRKRIEDRIGEEGRRTRKPWRTVWGLPAAVFGTLAVVLLGFWMIGRIGENPQSAGDRAQKMAATANSFSDASSAGQQKQYALLIGLRKDNPGKEGDITSTYRTVLVAHDAGRLVKAADAKGLFVPHKQNFWKLDTLSPGNGRQAIRALQVTNVSKAKPEPHPVVPSNRLSERVMFAGNQYVSLQTMIRDGSGAVVTEWQVKTIDEVNQKSGDPEAEPHVRLQELFPNLHFTSGGVNQWSIDRNPGQWVPVAYESGADGGEHFPAALPAQVVNRDALLISWQRIQQIEPSARDAFTYGNLLGVLAGAQIRVYELENGTVVRQVSTFPLAAGESLVMIQWAEGSYVDNWIREMKVLSRK